MKRWARGSWIRPVAGVLAGVFTLSQAVPMAFASSYSSLRAGAAAYSDVQREVITDPLIGQSVARDKLGDINVAIAGKERAEPARAEHRLFQIGLSDPALDAQVTTYALEYQGRYDKTFTDQQQDELKRRLREIAKVLGPRDIPVWFILDEVDLPALALGRGIGSVTDRALVAYSIEKHAVYVSSLALASTLIEQGAVDGFKEIVERTVASVKARQYQEPSREQLQRINAQIARALRTIRDRWNEAEVAALTAARQRVIRAKLDSTPDVTFSTADLGARFSGGIVPNQVIGAIQDILSQGVRDGTLTGGTVEEGARVVVRYRPSATEAATRIVNRIWEVVKTESAKASSPAPAASTATPLYKGLSREDRAQVDPQVTLIMGMREFSGLDQTAAWLEKRRQVREATTNLYLKRPHREAGVKALTDLGVSPELANSVYTRLTTPTSMAGSARHGGKVAPEQGPGSWEQFLKTAPQMVGTRKFQEAIQQFSRRFSRLSKTDRGLVTPQVDGLIETFQDQVPLAGEAKQKRDEVLRNIAAALYVGTVNVNEAAFYFVAFGLTPDRAYARALSLARLTAMADSTRGDWHPRIGESPEVQRYAVRALGTTELRMADPASHESLLIGSFVHHLLPLDDPVARRFYTHPRRLNDHLLRISLVTVTPSDETQRRVFAFVYETETFTAVSRFGHDDAVFEAYLKDLQAHRPRDMQVEQVQLPVQGAWVDEALSRVIGGLAFYVAWRQPPPAPPFLIVGRRGLPAQLSMAEAQRWLSGVLEEGQRVRLEGLGGPDLTVEKSQGQATFPEPGITAEEFVFIRVTGEVVVVYASNQATRNLPEFNRLRDMRRVTAAELLSPAPVAPGVPPGQATGKAWAAQQALPPYDTVKPRIFSDFFTVAPSDVTPFKGPALQQEPVSGVLELLAHIFEPGYAYTVHPQRQTKLQAAFEAFPFFGRLETLLKNLNVQIPHAPESRPDPVRAMIVNALRGTILPARAGAHARNERLRVVVVLAGTLNGNQMARYFDQEADEAVIAIDEAFYRSTIGAAAPADPAASRGAQRIFLERFLHELAHDNTLGTFEDEWPEEKRVLERVDLVLLGALRGTEADRDLEAFLARLPRTVKPLVAHKEKYQLLNTILAEADGAKRDRLLAEYAKSVVSSSGKAFAMPAAPAATPAPAVVREEIAQGFPELFGNKTIETPDGQTVTLNVEQAIATLTKELEPDIANALIARRKLLESPAQVQEKHGWPKWDDEFQHPVTREVRTRWQIVRGLIHNFLGIESEWRWRLNDEVPIPDDAHPLKNPGLELTGPWHPLDMAMNQLNAADVVDEAGNKLQRLSWEHVRQYIQQQRAAERPDEEILRHFTLADNLGSQKPVTLEELERLVSNAQAEVPEYANIVAVQEGERVRITQDNNVAVSFEDDEDAAPFPLRPHGTPANRPVAVWMGRRNVKQILAGEWGDGTAPREYRVTKRGQDRVYKIEKERRHWPTRIHRAPSIHLRDPYITINGKPVPAVIVSHVIDLLNNYGSLKKAKTGAYYYEPKIQTPQDAIVVAKLLAKLEDLIAAPHGTIKIAGLLEEGIKALHLPVIMWILSPWLTKESFGRWDWLGSLIEMWKNTAVFPDPQGIGMTSPGMMAGQRFTALMMLMAGMKNGELTNAGAVGGMAAVMLYPQTDPYGRWKHNPKALRAMKLDKLRERLIGLIFVPDDPLPEGVQPTLQEILTGKVKGRFYDVIRQSWVATPDKDYVAAGTASLRAALEDLQLMIDAPVETVEIDGRPVPTVASGLTTVERQLFHSLGLLNADGKITPWVITKDMFDSPEKLFTPELWESIYGVPKGDITIERIQHAFYMDANYGFQILNGNLAAAIDDYELFLRFMNDLATYRIFVGWPWTLLHHVDKETGLQGGVITKDGWLKKPKLTENGVVPGENAIFVEAGTRFTPALFEKVWELHNEWTEAFFKEQDRLAAIRLVAATIVDRHAGTSPQREELILRVIQEFVTILLKQLPAEVAATRIAAVLGVEPSTVEADMALIQQVRPMTPILSRAYGTGASYTKELSFEEAAAQVAELLGVEPSVALDEIKAAAPRFDRSKAPIIMDVLRRQLLSPRWLQHSARVLFAVVEANDEEREQILRAIFAVDEHGTALFRDEQGQPSRVKLEEAVASGALPRYALDAHDYVYDIVPETEAQPVEVAAAPARSLQEIEGLRAVLLRDYAKHRASRGHVFSELVKLAGEANPALDREEREEEAERLLEQAELGASRRAAPAQAPAPKPLLEATPGEADRIREWMESSRFERITPHRLWSAEEIADLQGEVNNFEDLRKLLPRKFSSRVAQAQAEGRPIMMGGAMDGPTVAAMAEAGLEAWYLSGWQTSHHWGQPDQARYPLDTVAKKLEEINKYLLNKHVDQQIRFKKLLHALNEELGQVFRTIQETPQDTLSGMQAELVQRLVGAAKQDLRIFVNEVMRNPDATLTPLFDSIVAEAVRQKTTTSQAQREALRKTMEGALKAKLVDYLLPALVDADTGHLSVKEMVRLLVEAGAAAIHVEDQVHGLKKCGHLPGKVVKSILAFFRTLLEFRKELDKLGSEIVLVARTDAKGAKLLESDEAPQDDYFQLGTSVPGLPSLGYVVRLARREVEEYDHRGDNETVIQELARLMPGLDEAEIRNILSPKSPEALVDELSRNFPDLADAIREVWRRRGEVAGGRLHPDEPLTFAGDGRPLGTVQAVWQNREAIEFGEITDVGVATRVKDSQGTVMSIQEVLDRRPAYIDQEIEATARLTALWIEQAQLKTYVQAVSQAILTTRTGRFETMDDQTRQATRQQWEAATDPLKNTLSHEQLRALAQTLGIAIEWDADKARTYEGYYQLNTTQGALNSAVRLRFYVRIADGAWMEKEGPGAAEEETLISNVRADPKAEGAFVAVNVSPSFNWLNPDNWKSELRPEQIANIKQAMAAPGFDWTNPESWGQATQDVQTMVNAIMAYSERVGRAGGVVQFVTVFSDHITTLNIFKVAQRLKESGAGGYVMSVQAEEHKVGSRFVEHQAPAGMERVAAEDALVFRGADAMASLRSEHGGTHGQFGPAGPAAPAPPPAPGTPAQFTGGAPGRTPAEDEAFRRGLLQERRQSPGTPRSPARGSVPSIFRWLAEHPGPHTLQAIAKGLGLRGTASIRLDERELRLHLGPADVPLVIKTGTGKTATYALNEALHGASPLRMQLVRDILRILEAAYRYPEPARGDRGWAQERIALLFAERGLSVASIATVKPRAAQMAKAIKTIAQAREFWKIIVAAQDHPSLRLFLKDRQGRGVEVFPRKFESRYWSWPQWRQRQPVVGKDGRMYWNWSWQPRVPEGLEASDVDPVYYLLHSADAGSKVLDAQYDAQANRLTLVLASPRTLPVTAPKLPRGGGAGSGGGVTTIHPADTTGLFSDTVSGVRLSGLSPQDELPGRRGSPHIAFLADPAGPLPPIGPGGEEAARQLITLNDIDLTGNKRVLMRVNLDVPIDASGAIDPAGIYRLEEALPTIRVALQQGGKVILGSHLGRPKGKVVPNLSLRGVAQELQGLLPETNVLFAGDLVEYQAGKAGKLEVFGELKRFVDERMQPGEVLVLENLRFHPEEEIITQDPADPAFQQAEAFARGLASLADVWINDDFGTSHRSNSSIVRVPKYVNVKAAGLLLEKEVTQLSRALHPQHPFVVILGGAKVSDKIQVIDNLLARMTQGDSILIGGAMAYTFLKAQGKEVGASFVELDQLETARGILATASARGVEVMLPVDHVATDDVRNPTKIVEVATENIPEVMKGADIGPQTIERFRQPIRQAKTILWNGPLGVFEHEQFARGTRAIAQALAVATGPLGQGATTIAGGGDTGAAVKDARVEGGMTHVSTGGGATLAFLGGEKLPGIAVVTRASDKGVVTVRPASETPTIASLDYERVNDSRGKETIRARIRLADGTVGDWFAVPAGKSKGKGEAPTVEVDDAVANLGRAIHAIITAGLKVGQQRDIDALLQQRMAEWGGNTTLAVSMAVAQAAATYHGIEVALSALPEGERQAKRTEVQALFNRFSFAQVTPEAFDSMLEDALAAFASHGIPRHVALSAIEQAQLASYLEASRPDAVSDSTEPVRFQMNVLNGGAHVPIPKELALELQEFMVTPKAATYEGALAMGLRVREALVALLQEEQAKPETERRITDSKIGDEGGLAPAWPNKQGRNAGAIDLLLEAIRRAGFESGRELGQVAIALDPAATSFSQIETGHPDRYDFEGAERDSRAMVEWYHEVVERVPSLDSIEDGLSEEDWDGFKALTDAVGSRIKVIGDDLLVTQTPRLQKGIEMGAGNAILIKPNQNGTLSGTLDAIAMAKRAGWQWIVSHRSGETMDTAIGDLAIGTRAYALKAGDPTQPVRRAKYNRVIVLDRLRATAAAATAAEEVFKLYRRSYDIAPPRAADGRTESLQDVNARAWLYDEAHVKPLLEQGENVIESLHGNSFRSLSMKWFGLTASEVEGFTFPLATLIRVRFKQDGTVHSVHIFEDKDRQPDPKNVGALMRLLVQKGIPFRHVYYDRTSQDFALGSGSPKALEPNPSGWGDVYALRHGQTISSDTVPGGAQGGFWVGPRVDVPLTDEGRVDAAMGGEIIDAVLRSQDPRLDVRNRTIRVAFTTPLRRAQETLREALDAMGRNVEGATEEALSARLAAWQPDDANKVLMVVSPTLQERDYAAATGYSREAMPVVLQAMILELWAETPAVRNANVRQIATVLGERWQELLPRTKAAWPHFLEAMGRRIEWQDETVIPELVGYYRRLAPDDARRAQLVEWLRARESSPLTTRALAALTAVAAEGAPGTASVSFVQRMRDLGITTDDPAALQDLRRTGMYGASLVDPQAWLEQTVGTEHQWIVVPVEALLNGPSTSRIVENLQRQREVGGGRKAIRVAVIDNRAHSALDAQTVKEQLLATMPTASDGTLQLGTEDIFVYQRTSPKELAALLAAQWPGSRLGGVLGEEGWAADVARHNPGVKVAAFTEGQKGEAPTVVSPALIDAVFTFATGRNLPPLLRDRLKQMGNLTRPRQDILFTDVEAPISEYERRMQSEYAAATKD